MEVFRCDQEYGEFDFGDFVRSEISDFRRGLAYRTTLNTCNVVAARSAASLLESSQPCFAPLIVKAFQTENISYMGKDFIFTSLNILLHLALTARSRQTDRQPSDGCCFSIYLSIFNPTPQRKKNTTTVCCEANSRTCGLPLWWTNYPLALPSALTHFKP